MWRFLTNLPSITLIGLVRCYQVVLSPIMGGFCRFQPSCSNYFIEAVEKYGAWGGTWRGLWRICRCNPFGGKGFDPP